MAVYHDLEGASEVDEGALTIDRAKRLLSAVRRSRQFKLLGIFSWTLSSGEDTECLVVEVACDGVPPKNPFKLQFRERLALVVRELKEDLPWVLALRKDFPHLLHQNRASPDARAHLCLYFEPSVEVLRTWTPERFLRRIQWWIESSARGELHPADQPIDHLFFSSKRELILPWNFDEAHQAGNTYSIVKSKMRPDGGITSFLGPKSKDEKTALLIDATLPPIVHGAVEPDPTTLGELYDLLKMRGIDLLPQLRDKVKQLVDEHGAVKTEEELATVLLLHIPVTRTPGGQVEGITHRAFFLAGNPLKLGVAIGGLMLHEGKYYRAYDVGGGTIEGDWRGEWLWPVDVLRENNSEAARRQAGIGEAGPKAVLVGAGALGSALVALWGRSGWGNWTVIDKDHLKPHNLSRHIGLEHQIGDPKGHVVAELHEAMSSGASAITSIYADVLKPSGNVQAAITAAQVVIDASAGLEYPRRVSESGDAPRHCSVFLTPTASACVALVEDSGRKHRLRSLEAQYYRAVLDSQWGKTHLEGAPTFWSGAGCRDISMVMPYAKVMKQAATLAESLPQLLADAGASIRIWQGDSNGSVEAYDFPVEAEVQMSVGDRQVFIDHGILRTAQTMRMQALPNETGGVLLGYFDFNLAALVIVAALPAPSDSVSTPSSFIRGTSGLHETIVEASRRTAGMVGYVGEWHSHPQGASTRPSGEDMIQLSYLATAMQEEGLPGVQLIVGESGIDVFSLNAS